MNIRRVPSLLVAVFLQGAPLIRTFEPVVTGVLQPLMMLFRVAAAATAVAGGAHALSGATGLLSAKTAKGTNGMVFSYRAQITSDEYGKALSYGAVDLPPGLSVTSSTVGAIGGTPTQAGTFTATITGYQNSNRSGFTFSESLVITILANPPVITKDPASQTVTEGDTVTLSVSVNSGDAPMFHWIKGGVEIPRMTGKSLVFSPVKLADAGSYVCRVQNSGGTAVSGAAALMVIPIARPPVINSISPDQTVHSGETVTLKVNASADTTPTYQWFLGATPVPGATQAILIRPKVTSTDAGGYSVVVTANKLSTSSGLVQVAVRPPLETGSVHGVPAGIRIDFNSIPGRQYFLESAPSFDAVNWGTLTGIIATQASSSLMDAPPPDAGQRFYRIRVQ